MVRDPRRNKSYFERFIEQENVRIEKFTEVLNGIAPEEKDKISQCRGYIFNFYKNKLTAMYSCGYSKSDIKSTFEQFIKYMPSSVESYADAIDILSLAILFDHYEPFKNITFEDKLINALKNYIKNKQIVPNDSPLLFNEEYGECTDILLFGSDTENKLIDFLENRWYNLNNAMSWYDSHESESGTYAGYWSWLCASIIKIKGWKTDHFISCSYLPIDLI